MLQENVTIFRAMFWGSDMNIENNEQCGLSTMERLFNVYVLYLGAFAKLRRATISLVMSVRPSVRKVQLTLNGFLWNLTFEYFLKVCRENSSFIKIWQKYWVLYVKTNLQFWSYLAHFFLEWEMFQTNLEKKSDTRFVFSKFYFENRAVYEIM
jgi:hypothetical protein